MEAIIGINQQQCIRCGKCARVCPSLIFVQPSAASAIEIENPQTCIGCGHCVTICPEDAVQHSEFPVQAIHAVDDSKRPLPDHLMALIRSRRSTRVFSKQPIPTQLLELILEAAHLAPTASNGQNVEFTIVTDPHKLAAVSRITISTFQRVLRKVSHPLIKPIVKRFMPDMERYIPAFERLIREHDAGNDMILRRATALILIHTPSRSRFGCQDANLAYQNGSLMAESLGVGHFYTGFVCSATKQPGGDAIARELGIEGTIHAGMALGMPALRYEKYVDRKPIVVSRI